MATEIVRELVAGEWVTKVGTGGGGGSVPTLAQVLAEGNDADTARIGNLSDPSNPQDADTQAARDAAIAAIPAPSLGDVLNEGSDGGNASITNIDSIEINGDLNHDGTAVGFYGQAPIAQQAYDSSGTDGDRITALETILQALGLAVDTAP